MGKNSKILLICCCVAGMNLLAQEDAENIFYGNQYYHSGKMQQAATAYARANELNPTNRKANFNLGNALYRNALIIRDQKISDPANPKMTPDSLSNLVLDRAIQNFEVVANSVSDKDTLQKAWHNIGNSYLQKKAYKEAANAYKKALKLDPKDEETRYNLAYALKHMPKEQKGGGGGGQPPPDQKKDRKDQKQQQSQMNKEQAEQLLKALMQAEKKLQDKRKQKQEDPSRGDGKDW